MKKTIILFFIFISSLSYGQEDYLLAEKYYTDGEYEKAAQLFKVLFDKNPFNTTYLKRLISAYQETSQFEL